jgi:hypothetical protein
MSCTHLIVPPLARSQAFQWWGTGWHGLAQRKQHHCRSRAREGSPPPWPRARGSSSAAGPAHVRALPPLAGHARELLRRRPHVRVGSSPPPVAPTRGISVLPAARARGRSPATGHVVALPPPVAPACARGSSSATGRSYARELRRHRPVAHEHGRGGAGEGERIKETNWYV